MTPDIQARLHSFEGMQGIFRLVATSKDGRSRAIIPWQLLDIDEGREEVARNIWNCLRKL
jgi:hypothetical protein